MASSRTCSRPGCTEPFLSRGLCDNHYKIAKRAGTLPPREKKRESAGTCAIAGCDAPQFAETWCREHYRAARRASVVRCATIGCGAEVWHHKSKWCEPHARMRHEARKRFGGQRKLTAPDGVKGPFSEADLDARLSVFGHRCAYCGGPFEMLDHLKPLANGGHHLLSNLRPSCRRCNGHKNAMGPTDWLQLLASGQEPGKCSVLGCDRRKHAKGMCTLHYQRALCGKNLVDSTEKRVGDSFGPSSKGTLERFMALVEKTDACWNWAGSIKPNNGYGQFQLKRPDGLWRNKPAHVVSHELFIGPVPDGMVVCHTCDRRSCVAPHHLLLGTRSENMIDARNKGRFPTQKLTADQVAAIRARYAEGGITHRALAKQYGVSGATVSHILSGRNWRT